KSFGSLVSQGSGERAVIVKQTQTCLYNEWRGIFGWSFDLHAIFAKSWKEQRTSSFRSVPFILVEGGRWPRSGYVHVNLDGSDHPLPLTTVYHQLHPIQATPYTLFQAIFGNGYPVALLDEEKILPVGKEITAVGFCRTRDGALEVKSCQELPFFLSEMTKDEIEAELATNTAALLWRTVEMERVEERRKRDRELRNQAASVPSGMEEELGEVPDGELCVICLMRRRRSAFIPCGHLVCCPSCALTVERDSFPKCPVCRQSIRKSQGQTSAFKSGQKIPSSLNGLSRESLL
ncbi:Baculoviral IAP repeat-containing protein 3, partial [Ananas comosus]